MRAVVICTGGEQAPEERAFAPMLTLLDRPFIHHVVDYLVGRGVSRFEFVLHHYPEKVESLLEDGTRWGCQFRFHLAQDPVRPYHCLRVLSAEEGEVLFLAHADLLPALPEAALPDPPPAWPLLLCAAGAGAAPAAPAWSGWAWVPAPALVAVAATNPDRSGMETGLRSRCPAEVIHPQIGIPVKLNGPTDLLAACRAVLAGEMKGLLFGGTEVEPGIWLSRNVSLHPTARLSPPVYIGENCRVERGVRLGPEVVVGSNCVLDEGCVATEAVVMPGSYVGQGLDLQQVVVDRNRLFSVRLGAEVAIADDFLLGSVAGGHFSSWLGRWCSRGVALGLLVALWPVVLATALGLRLLRQGPVWCRLQAVCLPAAAEERSWRRFIWWSFDAHPDRTGVGWRHLMLRFLPGLVNVCRGQLRFTGVEPRSAAEIRGLDPDWKALYLTAKAGLVTEAAVQYGKAPTPDECYSAEAFYAVRSGWWYDLRLLARYAASLLRGTPRADGPASGLPAQLVVEE